MPVRPSLCLAAALAIHAALLGGARLSAQERDASPYLPSSHWAIPYLEHLIAAGAIKDPTPLTRPLRRRDALRALEAADTLRLSVATVSTIRLLETALADAAEPHRVRLEGHVGLAAANYARRDPLAAIEETGPRQSGPGHGTGSADLELALVTDHVAAVTRPEVDTRLKYDPDWFGKKDRVIAGRTAEAYVDAEWQNVDLFFGRLDRNWGPSGIQGLLLSDDPYGLDHFHFSLGTTTLKLQWVAAQLDDLDSAGVVEHRFMMQHRLLFTPEHWAIALWDASVVSGQARSFDFWYLNPLNLGILEQWNKGGEQNAFLGFDVQHTGAITLFAQFLLDDIQIDRNGPGDLKPPSYGFTIGAKSPLGSAPASGTLFYTRVTNLTYRNEDPYSLPLYHFLGTGRNFDDYDQATLQVTVLPRAGLLLTPEITLLRQGEGDPRLPQPPVSAYSTTATIFQGVVERALRLAIAGRYAPSERLSVTFDAGVHHITNYQHVTGDTRTRVLGTVGVAYRFRGGGPLP
ncbi:MAG TPA: hypothetical protein VM736_15505 [Gemmatimonadales bacterium]|nr:hypothetical protein [Gemmatimonadales bacterium]